jgi:MFS family permease
MTFTIAPRVRQVAAQVRRSSLITPKTVEDHNARLMYLSTAMLGVPVGGIMAFLPVFLVRLGASSATVGWLSSAPALLSIFLLIPGAAIAERNPNQVQVRVRYSRLLRLSFLFCALAPLFVPLPYLPLILVVLWTLKTIPDAIAIPAWTAVMAQAISPQRRARLNGNRWALLSLVSATCSAAFGALLDHVAFPLNYQLVFLLSFALGWLDPMFFAHIQVPDLERDQTALPRHLIHRFGAYLKPVMHNRMFLVFLASTILYRVALNLPAPLFSIYWVNDLEATDSLIGLRGTVGYAALVVGYIFWGRSANRLGHRRVLTLSALGLALYPILTSLVPSAIWILPVAALWGLTAAGVDVGLFDLILACIPKQRQPLFAAVWSMVANTAVFVGPLLGATLAESTTTGTALLLAGAMQIVTTIGFAKLPSDV